MSDVTVTLPYDEYEQMKTNINTYRENSVENLQQYIEISSHEKSSLLYTGIMETEHMVLINKDMLIEIGISPEIVQNAKFRVV